MIELKCKSSSKVYNLQAYCEQPYNPERWRVLPENCTEWTTVPKCMFEIVEVDDDL
jgi:hypothetical protein